MSNATALEKYTTKVIEINYLIIIIFLFSNLSLMKMNQPRKVKIPKSPNGSFERFINFQRALLQG